MKSHEENIEIYLDQGGDIKIANRYKLPTIQNRAKVCYLLSQLPVKQKETSPEVIPLPKKDDEITIQEINTIESSKPSFIGFISNYPTDLHSVYKDCYNAWLDVCQLKIQLNEIPPLEQEAAYKIQLKIFKAISVFDRNRKVLDYWNEDKRILPIASKKDYSKFTPLELDQERRNLASLITRRKQTILKREKDLPSKDAVDYNRKFDFIREKKEQLEELILDYEKVVGLINR